MSQFRRLSHRSLASRIPVLAAIAAMLLLGQRASATPTGVSFVLIIPSDGNTLYVARTAADNPLDPPTFQLKADVYFDNFSGADAEVTECQFWPRKSFAAVRLRC